MEPFLGNGFADLENSGPGQLGAGTEELQALKEEPVGEKYENGTTDAGSGVETECNPPEDGPFEDEPRGEPEVGFTWEAWTLMIRRVVNQGGVDEGRGGPRGDFSARGVSAMSRSGFGMSWDSLSGRTLKMGISTREVAR